MSIYLDYNASAPIDTRVIDVMVDIYKNRYGNADSRTHEYGEAANKIVEDSRKAVAELIGCRSDEVFFTSGATESINIALQGLRDYSTRTGKNHIITTAIEHKAVLETASFLEKNGFEVDYIKPSCEGFISVEDVISLIKPETLIVSIMHVNNETGVIQPVELIGDILEQKGVLFHIDITQSCGKLVDEIRKLKYDMLSMSAHKLSGPQGIGALVLKRKKYKLPPVKSVMHGGQQERGLRPGTLPVALIAGLGEACQIAQMEYKKNRERCISIKKMLIETLESSGLDFSINGSLDQSLYNTLNVCINGVSSEALMIAARAHCAFSNGSACTSKDYSPSYVLEAMGVPNKKILESIRLSWGGTQDIDLLKKEFLEMIKIAKSLV